MILISLVFMMSACVNEKEVTLENQWTANSIVVDGVELYGQSISFLRLDISNDQSVWEWEYPDYGFETWVAGIEYDSGTIQMYLDNQVIVFNYWFDGDRLEMSGEMSDQFYNLKFI